MLLPDYKQVLTCELVLWHLKIQRGGALPDPPGGIVMRPMTGAEVAAIIPLISNRDTSEMGADTNED